jgi:hypothetical protein
MLRYPALLACAIAIGVAACSDQPNAPLKAPQEMTFRGTFAVAARLPDGTIKSSERPWSAVARVGDLGAYSREVSRSLRDRPELYGETPVEERPAPIPVLALSSGHQLAQWRANEPVLHRFRDGATEAVLVIERSTTSGPPTQVTVFESGRPSQVLRFEWRREGELWVAARTGLTVWRDGVPALQFVARVDDAEPRLSAAAEAGAMLSNAAGVVQSLVIPVLSAVVLPAKAEAQLYFWDCRYEWLDILKRSGVLAAMLTPIGRVSQLIDVIMGIGFVSGTFDYIEAIFKLLDCVKEQENSGGTPSGDSTGTAPPPLGLAPPSSRAPWVRDLLAARDSVCAPTGEHFALCK